MRHAFIAPARLQVTLEGTDVQRWTSFSRQYEDHPVRLLPDVSRRQTVTGHTASVQIATLTVLSAVRRFDPCIVLDEGLVLGCLALHDLGEHRHLERGHDTQKPAKKRDDDVQELAHFLQLIEDLPPELRDHFTELFMLQYAHEPGSLGPNYEDALKDLSRKYPNECALIPLIEHYDYALYAWHELWRRGDLRIVVHTMRNSHSHLTDGALGFHGFVHHVYTRRVQDTTTRLLRLFEGIDEKCITRSLPKEHVDAILEHTMPEDLVKLATDTNSDSTPVAAQ